MTLRVTSRAPRPEAAPADMTCRAAARCMQLAQSLY
jgi:hypothetical protein